MLIVGKRTRHLQSKISSSATCPNCNQTGNFEFSYSSRHIHFFWIPTFPYRKYGSSKCLNCNQVMKPKEMPDPIKREYDRFKTTVAFPIKLFTGLLVYPVLFIWLATSIGEDNKQEALYLKSPIIGDVYTIKKERKKFTTYRVSVVDSLGVFVRKNFHHVEKRFYTYRVDSLHLYDTVLTRYFHAELDSMMGIGWIDGVKRGE